MTKRRLGSRIANLENVRDYSDKGARYIPTPEEIAQAAADIRATWSERERASRCRLAIPEPVELKQITLLRTTKYLSGDYS